METPGMDIRLGGHEYRVVPQPQGRLTRRLFGPTGVFGSLEELTDITAGDSIQDLLGLATGKVHELLQVFIPDLMPQWEFEGYASESAAERNEYDETGDRSPTHPEVIEAFKTAVQVNGLRWLNKLTELVDPKVVRSQANATVARVAAEARKKASEPSTPSASLPQPNGESSLTSSGESEPTQPPPSPEAIPSA